MSLVISSLTDPGSASWSDVVLIPVGATREVQIPFLGAGVGATKPTQVVDGPTIAEQLGIADELYAFWRIESDRIDLTVSLILKAHFYLNASEVGKVVSFDLAVGVSNGDPVNDIEGTVQVVDFPVADQWIDTHADFQVDAATFLSATDQSGLHFRIKRVASSDDPTAHPRIHSLTLLETFADPTG